MLRDTWYPVPVTLVQNDPQRVKRVKVQRALGVHTFPARVYTVYDNIIKNFFKETPSFTINPL